MTVSIKKDYYIHRTEFLNKMHDKQKNMEHSKIKYGIIAIRFAE